LALPVGLKLSDTYALTTRALQPAAAAPAPAAGAPANPVRKLVMVHFCLQQETTADDYLESKLHPSPVLMRPSPR